MTTPPGGQFPPQQYPQQPYPGPPPGGGGRKALPWIIGAVVVVAALVVTLVLTLGGDDNEKTAGAGDTSADSGESGGDYDLSTPQKAAESFVAAAATGDGQVLLQLTCLRELACVNQRGEEEITQAELREAQQIILDAAPEAAEKLEGVEFGEPTEGSIPGSMEVPYTTSGSDYQSLMFVEFEGEWLYAGSAGGSGGGGEGAGAGPPTT